MSSHFDWCLAVPGKRKFVRRLSEVFGGDLKSAVRRGLRHGFWMICAVWMIGSVHAANPFVHRLFNSNMVLQRDTEAPVWGWTTPGAQVTVSINGQAKSTTATPSGRWQVEVGPFPAGGPYTMTIAGPQAVTLTNVMMGDVWFFAGQSNMAYNITSLNHPNNPAEIADSANYPHIRNFPVPGSLALAPQENLGNGSWVAASPSTVAAFSGAAYYTSREISKRLGNVPVGMLTSAWSGSQIRAWLSPTAAAEEVDFSDNLFEDQLLSSTNDPTTVSCLFNSMVAPLAPFKIKGVVWYQGESNVGLAEQYERLLSKFRTVLRTNFNQPNLPFIVIQLPDFGTLNANIVESGWPELREAQRKAVQTDPNSRYVPTIELSGDGDLHPSNKQDVGKRASLAAASVAYGETLVHHGPELSSAVPLGNTMVCTFENVGAGLMLGSKTPLQPTQEVPGTTVTGFILAGEDRVFKAANATISGPNTVTVTSPGVSAPRYVRYAWKNRPVCNLYNKITDLEGNVIDGLPASSFRNDPVARLEVFGGNGSITTQPGSIVTASFINSAQQSFSHWSGDIEFMTHPSASSTPVTLSRAYTSVRANYTLIGAPSGFGCISLDGQLDVRWNAIAGCRYIIYRSATSGGTFTQVSPVLVRTTSFVDTGLVNGTTYYYKIRAINAQGEGPLSAEAAGTPQLFTEATDAVYANVPEAAGYELAYAGTLSATGVGNSPFSYTVDRQASVAPGGFDRVAYYVELVDLSGKYWVYASMDAFTQQAGQLRIPHATQNPVTFQTEVTNLAVKSNHPGIRNGSFDRGGIEMWHFNYGGNNAKSVFGATGAYDWGDEIGTTPSGYGSFQVHNPAAKQVLFAYNGWAGGGGTTQLGIGNAPTGSPDWTFTANATSYSSRKLVILVRPKSSQVVFTALPKNQQIVPRNLQTNTATIPIAGKETSGGYQTAVLKTFRNGVTFEADVEVPLFYANGEAAFAFNPEIPAELASYDFEIHLRKEGTDHLVRRVSDVAAGDAYLWYGQSNAQAGMHNGSANAYASPWIRTYGMSSDSAVKTQAYPFWSQAVGDGSLEVAGGVGQWALVVARKIVDDHGVPVAILNGGRGGYSMPQLQRDDANPNELADGGGVIRTYNRLRYLAIDSGLAARIRGIFFYQGESDNNNTGQHVTGFAGLMADWQEDYPAVERVFVSQVHVGCNVTRESPELRDAQRTFASVYPKVRVMSTNGLITHTDNCHFPFVGGYETHGLNNYRQMSRELYGSPDLPDIDPPNPARVEISNPAATRLLIVLKRPAATISLEPGALADFRLTGSTAVPSSAQITPQGVELHYDVSIGGATSLAYLAHIGGGGGWIRNANGIGLLAFSEPILNPAPIVTSSLNLPVELTAGTSQQTTVSATSPEGQIKRIEVWMDGILYRAENTASLTFDWTVPPAGKHGLVFRAINDAGYIGEKTVVVFSSSGPVAPAGISFGLSAWLKPEKGLVTDSEGYVLQWQDSSIKGNHASQAVANARPKVVANAFGLMPGVYFDGNDFLGSSDGLSTQAYTKIARVVFPDFGTSGNIISSGSGSNPNALFMANSSNAKIWHNGNTLVNSSTPMIAGKQHIVMATYHLDSKRVVLYLDGVAVGLNDNATITGATSYQLGAVNGVSFLRGTIGEAIIYDRALEVAELNQIQTYLVNKSLAPAVAPGLNYSAWSMTHVPSGMDADPNAQMGGIPNFLRYALGLGAAATPSNFLQMERDADQLRVSYQHPTDRVGVTYQLFESPDLSVWTPVADQSGSVLNGIENRFYTRGTSNQKQLFYRLQVQAP